MIRRRFRQVSAGNREEGQGLIVVLFISLILMALVVAATTITASQVVPSRQSIDSAAALAAADGGVNDFIVEVNSYCKTPGSCAYIAGSPVKNNVVLGGGRAQFSWSVMNPLTYVTDGFVRVQSVGTINPGASNAESRTLVADIKGSPNLLDYLFVTKYETQAAASVTDRFKPRSIPLDSSVTGATFTKKTPLTAGSTVTWNGAGSSTTQPAVSTCDTYWYNSTSTAGTPVTGRQAQRVASGISDPNNAGVDWGEVGSVGGVGVTRTDSCEISFSTVSKMNGKVYSEDALLISSSVLGGAGPTFRDLVQTKWSTSATPAANSSKIYRTFAQLPASAPALGSKLPQTAASGPVLPTWDGTAAAAAATCTYTGPTRIRIVGANVVVTSPLTPDNTVGPSYCYASTNLAATVPQVGSNRSVYEARYPYAGKTIYVKDLAPATTAQVYAPQVATTARTAANSLFLASSAPTTSTTPVAPITSAPTWTKRWSTVLGAANTETRFVGERYGLGALLQNFTTFQDATAAALVAATTATPAQTLSALLDGAIASAFATTQNDTAPPLIGNAGRRYLWAPPTSTSVGPTTTTGATTTASSTGLSADALLAGSTTTTTFINTTVETVTTTVNRQERLCTRVGLACTWANTAAAAEAQFTVTATKTTAANGTTTVTTSAFPIVSDRTAYSSTTGDAYIEGTITGALSVAAQSNVIVTGDTKQTNGSAPTVAPTEVPYFSSTDALVLAAQKNVLLYHPVSCRTAPIAGTPPTSGTTTVGYCPNDVTGLYTGGMSLTTFDAAHPSRQYVNLSATPVRQVDAAIFALNGSFQLMNYNRGVELGTLKVNGGIYQQHHGVTGVEWETLTTNSATRRQSGYNLDYLHDRTLVGKGFPWIPTTNAVSGLVWNLQGTTEKVGTP